MGRNSGSQIFWTNAWDGTGHTFTYYCQQHAEYEKRTAVGSLPAMFNLEGHFEGEHGCSEQ